MITIYHNPRCSKSRAACELVTQIHADDAVEVVEYLKHPLTVDQLKALQKLLDVPLIEMVRTGETEYTDLNLGAEGSTDETIYEAIARHPILMQRPIVVRDDRAVIGRPTENIEALFK